MVAARRKTRQLQVRVSAAEKAAIEKAAERAGVSVSAYVLGKVVPNEERVWRESVARLRRQATPAHYAAVLDLLAELTAPQFAALPPLDARTLAPETAAWLAAVVEDAALRRGAVAPAWTAAVPAAPQPWFVTDNPGLRQYLALHAPVVFRRRNLFFDAGADARV